MKRIVVSLAVLLAVGCLVRLAVSQEAPKPEPKYYASVQVTVRLKNDADEVAVGAELIKLIDAHRSATTTINIDWHPASTGSARKEEIDRNKRFNRDRALSPNARTSRCVSFIRTPITVEAGQAMQRELMPYASDPRLDYFHSALQFYTEDFEAEPR